MKSLSSLLAFLVMCLISTGDGLAQSTPLSSNPPPIVSDFEEESEGADGLSPALKTQGGARTLVLSIPAPRGQIVDRGGRPLAQTRVAHFASIQFRTLEDPTDAQIIGFGREATRKLNEALGHTAENAWSIPDEEMLSHYQNRRWVPLMFDNTLDESEMEKIKHLVVDGIQAHPVYLRHYPRGPVACHILGYVGKTRPLPKGPIQNGEPLFWEWEGRSGLEASFNQELTGTPGELNVVYDGEGREISREVLRRPIAGQTIVLTIDADMQELAEESMTATGAFVVCDANNGEILVLASEPRFDPNEFVPSISEEAMKKLSTDPRDLFYARAFQGTYPPASTFKISMSVAILKDERIGPTTRINSPGYITIGNQRKRNAGGRGFGSIDIRRAISSSVNTWFYQAGMMVGEDALHREAINFGYGSPTRIPLDERAGTVPNTPWMLENHSRKMYAGDVANLVIGQGDVRATPLQVAQGMTGIATGNEIWRARLIKQTQNHRDEVLVSTEPQLIGTMGVSEKFLEPIRQGMIDVVHSGHGTGKQGYVSYARMAAKTGTGELPGRKQMGWFAGYLPANDPQFTFAVAYEGTGRGSISGGGRAAPIAKNFFNRLYRDRDPSKDLYAEVRTPGGDKKKKVESEEKESAVASNTPRRNRSSSSSNRQRNQRQSAPAPAPQPEIRKAVPVQEPPPKKRSFLDRLLGR